MEKIEKVFRKYHLSTYLSFRLTLLPGVLC